MDADEVKRLSFQQSQKQVLESGLRATIFLGRNWLYF